MLNNLHIKRIIRIEHLFGSQFSLRALASQSVQSAKQPTHIFSSLLLSDKYFAFVRSAFCRASSAFMCLNSK